MSLFAVQKEEGIRQYNRTQFKELLEYFKDDEDTLKIVKEQIDSYLKRMEHCDRVERMKKQIPNLDDITLIKIEQLIENRKVKNTQAEELNEKYSW